MMNQVRLVLGPGSAATELQTLLQIYKKMESRGTLEPGAVARAIVHPPRMDRPMYIWIIYTEEGEPCGELSLFNVDNFSRVAEVGFLTAGDCPNMVFARAFLDVCRFAFEKLELHRLEAWVRVSNGPVVRLAKKFGFKHEGTARQSARTVTGKLEDTLLFGMLHEEFLERWGDKDGNSTSLASGSSYRILPDSAISSGERSEEGG